MTKQKSFVSFTLHPDPNWHGTRMEPLLMVPTIWWISAETDILWPFRVSMLPSLANIHVVPQTLMEKTKKPLKCQVSNCCLETLFTPTIYFGYNTINKKNPFWNETDSSLFLPVEVLYLESGTKATNHLERFNFPSFNCFFFYFCPLFHGPSTNCKIISDEQCWTILLSKITVNVIANGST